MKVINHKEDYILMHRYLTGDKDAGKELYASIYPILQGYVFARTKESKLNNDDMEEIILDTLYTSLNKLSTFTGESKFSTLVIGIARIKIKEKYRKKKVQEDKFVDIDNIVDLENLSEISLMGRNPLEILIQEEKKQAVNDAIKMLSQEHREILTLRLLNNMPFKQISLLSGKSEAAVDSLFRRAVKNFKENFENIYF